MSKRMNKIFPEGDSKAKIGEVRNFLKSKISNLESTIGKSISSEELNPKKEELSQLYLEYAFTSRSEEAIVYAHKAVSLNPTIKIASRLNFLKEYYQLTDHDAGFTLAAQSLYRTEKTPGQIKILESFLNGIKEEAKEKGTKALEEHESIYRLIQRKEIPDPHQYADEISNLTGSEFEAEKKRIARQEIGVGTFLAEMLLSKEGERRDRERWKKGSKLPEVSFRQLQNIFSPNYPRHVIIDEEALGGIVTGSTRRYESIDDICDKICLEIAKRLPRRLDAYRFGQEEAHDEIKIKGLGKVKANLWQTGNGIFTSISSVEADSFRIHNCRDSGRHYSNKYNDIALPMEIKINPLDLEIHLYEDDSGIFVKTQGLEYSNSEARVFGVGHNGDSFRDEMYPTRRGFRETSARDIVQFLKEKKIWRKSSIDGRKFFDEFALGNITRDKQKYISFLKEINRPFQLSWNKVNHQATEWLEKNILEKIIATSEYENQATTLPEPIPYPKNMGRLYTWIPAKNAEKLEITGDDPSKVFLDERYAVPVGRRLVSLDIKGDFPKKANYGFIWCGIGEAKPNTSHEQYMIPGHHMESNDFLDYRNKLVQVIPKNGEDIFVVDYKVWDDFRERAFKKTDLLSDKQYAEMHKILARTLVPVSQYKGNYKKPVVLVGRDLDFDEVSIVPGVEYNTEK